MMVITISYDILYNQPLGVSNVIGAPKSLPNASTSPGALTTLPLPIEPIPGRRPALLS